MAAGQQIFWPPHGPPSPGGPTRERHLRTQPQSQVPERARLALPWRPQLREERGFAHKQKGEPWNHQGSPFCKEERVLGLCVLLETSSTVGRQPDEAGA